MSVEQGGGYEPSSDPKMREIQEGVDLAQTGYWCKIAIGELPQLKLQLTNEDKEQYEQSFNFLEAELNKFQELYHKHWEHVEKMQKERPGAAIKMIIMREDITKASQLNEIFKKFKEGAKTGDLKEAVGELGKYRSARKQEDITIEQRGSVSKEQMKKGVIDKLRKEIPVLEQKLEKKKKRLQELEAENK